MRGCARLNNNNYLVCDHTMLALSRPRRHYFLYEVVAKLSADFPLFSYDRLGSSEWWDKGKFGWDSSW